MRTHVCRCGVGLLLTLVVARAAATGSREYWPDAQWRTSTPEAQGVSSAGLAKAFDFIAAEQPDIHSLLVVRNGFLILEAYFYPCDSGDLHDICSCTKSVSSTLVGIAIDKGMIDSVREPLASLFPGRVRGDDPRRARITLEHLLTMSSGLDYPLLGEPRLQPMRAAPDMVQFILDLPIVAEPGTVFGYNSGGSHLLSALVTARTGQAAEQFARQNLFGPLGIRDIRWPVDAQGNSRGWGDLMMRSPDMAKLGYLFLKKGRWEERQVVSRRWVEEATRRHSSPPGAAGYGYQWWLQDDPARFEALGRGGQRVTVVPSIDTVVVFTGGGFEPGDVGAFVASAVRSGRALPEDPAAYADLQARIVAAAAPPAAKPVPALPPLAARVSGRRYALDAFDLGLLSIRYTFAGGDTAGVELQLADHTESHPVGLDGVSRISRQRPDGEPVALHGSWLSDREFVFSYNAYTTVQNMTVRAVFREDRISLRITDAGDNLDMRVEGREDMEPAPRK